MDGRVYTAGIINILAGVWLIISPYVLGFSAFQAATTNSVILGIIIAAMAIVRMSIARSTWASWANVILGVWLLVSPFLLLYFDLLTPTWNSIVLGLIVVVFAGWNTRLAFRERQRITPA